MTATDAQACTYGPRTVENVTGLDGKRMDRYAGYLGMPPVGSGRHGRWWTLGQMVTAGVVATESSTPGALGPLLTLLCEQLPQVIDLQGDQVASWVIVRDGELTPVAEFKTVAELLRTGDLAHVVDLRPFLDRVDELAGRAPP